MLDNLSCSPPLFPPLDLLSQAEASAGIFKQSMGAIETDRVGTEFLYRPARLHRLAGRYDSPIPTRFQAPIDCTKIPETVFLNF
jgi:hypothetical protein